MIEAYIYLFIIAGIISLIRGIIGPTFADRYLGISSLTGIIVLGFVVLAIQSSNQMFMDLAIILVMLSFVGTLAISKYSPGRDKNDP